MVQVPIFMNSSQVIHNEDTLCCYLVTHRADRQNFSYSLSVGQLAGSLPPTIKLVPSGAGFFIWAAVWMNKVKKCSRAIYTENGGFPYR